MIQRYTFRSDPHIGMRADVYFPKYQLSVKIVDMIFLQTIT